MSPIEEMMNVYGFRAIFGLEKWNLTNLLTVRKSIRIWITADVTQLFDSCLLHRIPKGHIGRHLNI